MVDKNIELEPGHKRVIQRQPKPASGWISDGSTTVADDDSVTIPSLVGIPPDPDPDPTPIPPTPPTATPTEPEPEGPPHE